MHGKQIGHPAQLTADQLLNAIASCGNMMQLDALMVEQRLHQDYIFAAARRAYYAKVAELVGDGQTGETQEDGPSWL